MSQQNTPGNDPNNGRDESQSPYGAQGAADAPSNPYFGTAQAEPAPDLDAAAPQLRSAEEQRLNRKALLFLGGIVVLLVAMGFLLFRKGQMVMTPRRRCRMSHVPARRRCRTLRRLRRRRRLQPNRFRCFRRCRRTKVRNWCLSRPGRKPWNPVGRRWSSAGWLVWMMPRLRQAIARNRSAVRSTSRPARRCLRT